MTKKDWLVYATESSNKRKSIDQEQLEIDEQETIREIYQKVLHLQDIAYIKALILKDLYEDELKKQYAHGLNLPAAERKKYQGRIRTFVRLRDTHSFQMLMSRMVFKRRANRSDKKFDLYQLGMNKEGTKYNRHQFRKCELWLRYLIADLDDQYCALRQRQSDLNKIRQLLQQYSQKTFELHQLTRSTDSPFGIGYRDRGKDAEKSALVLTANLCHQMIKKHQMQSLGAVYFDKLVKPTQKIIEVDNTVDESDVEDDLL